MPTALITGITGQDGSYLAELLLEKGYEVHGIIRRSSSFNTARIDHLMDRLHLHYGDLTDLASIENLLAKTEPDEVYHLAAQSHVLVSFELPLHSVDVDGMGTLRLLEAVRRIRPKAKVYHASTSEMFGSSPPPQNEDTPFRPRSPYAVAKVMAHHLVQNYRERGLWISAGILFNHESPRRGETFVTRKITRAATRIKLGLQTHLILGNLSARRDWGWAPDYVEAMWLMLQEKEPDDYVVATGKSWTVAEVCKTAFEAMGLDWTVYVKEDERYKRPTEVEHLRGDAMKARSELLWKPTVDFHGMIHTMVESDLQLAEREVMLQETGHEVRDRSGS